jgi:hypothetical protein
MTCSFLQKRGRNYVHYTFHQHIEYLDFYITRYLPEYEKNYPGVKLHAIKGIRGENENSFGLLFIFNSVEVRDKYWPQKDVNSESAQEASKKMQPVIEDSLGTLTEMFT